MYLSKLHKDSFITKLPSQSPTQGTSLLFPSPIFPQNRFFVCVFFYSALFLRLIHSPQLPDHLVASCSPTSGPPKLTRHPPRSGDLKPLRALPLTFAQAVSARRSPPRLAPPVKECFGQSSSEAPPLRVYWSLPPKSRLPSFQPRLPAPQPLFSFPLSHEAVASPKWEEREEGGK